MKSKKLFIFIPVIVATTLFSGCGFVKPNNPIERVKLKQSYMDFGHHHLQNLTYTPSKGTIKSLVIPIWFTDSNNFISDSKKESVRQDIQKVCFGTPEEIGWHSLKSYYETESFGALTFNGVVTPWYEVGKSASVCGSDSYNTANLANTAVEWYFSNNPSVDRKSFDYDHDGNLDSVILIYGAPDYQQNGFSSYSNFWAYTTWTTAKGTVNKPVTNVFFWCSYDFFYGSNIASSKTGHNYAHGDTSHINLDSHTLIHENGHMFGLPDYYDYADDNQKCYAGGFSMQDYNVGGHDAYSVMALGWGDPYIPTSDVTLTIESFQTSHDMILLTSQMNKYLSPFDEYLLLELYTPEGLNAHDSTYRYRGGYPQGPSIPGIRLWHVDARLLDYYKSSTSYVLTSDATINGVYPYTDNTSVSGSNGRKPFGNIGMNNLQLIRNDDSQVWNTDDWLSAYDLFLEGDSFDMVTFSGQFLNGTKLNNKKTLGWSFKVESIKQIGGKWNATISLDYKY